MANSLTSLDRGRPSSLARLRRSNLLNNARQGIAASYAVVTYKGRNFRLKYRTEEKLVRDDRGRAATYIDVVIIGVSPNISRQFFPRAYTEGDSDGPDCFSTDGITPDVGVPHKQNPVCGTCKHSQWGSRVTDAGKRAKACQETRRIAVVPLGDIENELMGGPMLLRIPPMSLNNLSNYSDFLASKGASFETVATRIGFDENVAYPRLSFETLDWLDDNQQLLSTGDTGEGGMVAHPLIERMLGVSSDAPAEPQQAPPRQAPVEPPIEDDEEMTEDEADEDEPEEEVAPPPAARRAAPKAEPNPFEEEVKAPAPRGRPRKNGQAKTLQVESDMESVLDNLLGT